MQKLSEKQKNILKSICNIAKTFFYIYNFIKEKVKNILKIVKNIFKIIYNIIKMILIIVLIFAFPFILPCMLRILIKVNCFENIEDFTTYLNVFSNKYVIIYLSIGILLFLNRFHKLENTFNKISERITKFTIELFGNKVSAEMEQQNLIEESNKNKELAKELLNEYNSEETQRNVIQDIKKMYNMHGSQMQLSEFKEGNDSCEDCNIRKIEIENNKLRNFAAYNIINIETKRLLHKMYNEKRITVEKFKKDIISGYKRRNKKNMELSNKNINTVANNKYETVFNGLKFLNIIEPSENDDEIKLTKDGIKFVEEYIEDREERL